MNISVPYIQSALSKAKGVVFFQHGYASDGNSFETMAKTLERDFKDVIFIGCVKVYNGKVIVDYANPNLTLDSLKNIENKTILILTEFPDKFGSNSSQVLQLAQIISTLVKKSTIPVSLIGHSRGGLVNAEYTTIFHSDINLDTIISIDTPYNDNELAKLVRFFNEGAEDLSGKNKNVELLQESWNHFVKNNRNSYKNAYAIATKPFKFKNVIGDFAVSTDSQAAIGFEGIDAIIFEDKTVEITGVEYIICGIFKKCKKIKEIENNPHHHTKVCHAIDVITKVGDLLGFTPKNNNNNNKKVSF